MSDREVFEKAVSARRLTMRPTFFFCRECGTMFSYSDDTQRGKRRSTRDLQALAHLKSCRLRQRASTS